MMVTEGRPRAKRRSNQGVFTADGMLIDKPQFPQHERILERAGR